MQNLHIGKYYNGHQIKNTNNTKTTNNTNNTINSNNARNTTLMNYIIHILIFKEYPTDDHLVQHMGNFHNYVDRYIDEEKGQFVLNEERTVKVFSKSCEICKRPISSGAEAKAHFSRVHFGDQLKQEFSIDGMKKCPKCSKGFENSTSVLSHVGSFHDEVCTLYNGERQPIPPQMKSQIRFPTLC